MTSPVITNSLLRIDGYIGYPPAPFEKPNPDYDFIVLELGVNDDMGTWCICTMETIRRYAEFLKRASAEGASLTLFVEHTPSEPVLRFDVSLLSILAETGISLECSYGAV